MSRLRAGQKWAAIITLVGGTRGVIGLPSDVRGTMFTFYLGALTGRIWTVILDRQE